jgi:hypothetical protein
MPMKGVWHLRKAAHSVMSIPSHDRVDPIPFVTFGPDADLKSDQTSCGVIQMPRGVLGQFPNRVMNCLGYNLLAI